MIKISIITINYNNYLGLHRTILSVINQTYQDFEYLVIDGGSSDRSMDLISYYSDRFSFWQSKPDNGIYNAMNIGIAHSTGEYLLFLNSGDELYDNKVLYRIKNKLNTFDVITGNLNIIEPNKEHIGISKKDLSLEQLLNDTVWHPCSFIRRDAFKKAGLYDEKLKICSDWKWFLYAFVIYKLTYKKIDLVISKFYLDGISSDVENKKLIKQERQITVNEIFRLLKTNDKIIELLAENINNRYSAEAKYEKIINRIFPRK